MVRTVIECVKEFAVVFVLSIPPSFLFWWLWMEKWPV